MRERDDTVKESGADITRQHTYGRRIEERGREWREGIATVKEAWSGNGKMQGKMDDGDVVKRGGGRRLEDGGVERGE